MQYNNIDKNRYMAMQDEIKNLKKQLTKNSNELRKTNEKLKEKHNLLTNVSNSITDAIFYKDLNHKYLGCNKNYADFLNITEDEIVGKKDSDFFDEKSIEAFHLTQQLIVEKKEKVEYKHWIKYKDKNIYVLTIKSPLFNDKGDMIGIVGISRDITKEFNLQQEIDKKNLMLIQQNKLISMGEMIANIAHQWRQPLNIMGLILQKIDLYNKKEKLNKKTLHKMIQEAMFLLKEMSQTIDDFRNFFNPNKEKEMFSLKEIIEKSNYILKPQIQKSKIDFKYDTKNDYLLYGYKNEFFQVIMNIIHNAIDALIINNIQNPTIKIRAKIENETVTINIIDNANGIAASDIHKIFEPYFTTKENGTGLGLYMSKIIIEKHMDGILSAKNEKDGTNFIIKLYNKEKKTDSI